MGNYGGCDTCGSRRSCDCAFRAQLAEAQEQLAKAESARKHTQDWYARHYGKLQDWARKRLPETWRDEFFCCIANGTWGFEDKGKPYTLKDGSQIVPPGCFRTDTAEGQLILDQTRRAEEAEQRSQELEALVRKLLKSAVPHPTEHPTMWAAWKEAEVALSSVVGPVNSE